MTGPFTPFLTLGACEQAGCVQSVSLPKHTTQVISPAPRHALDHGPDWRFESTLKVHLVLLHEAQDKGVVLKAVLSN